MPSSSSHPRPAQKLAGARRKGRAKNQPKGEQRPPVLKAGTTTDADVTEPPNREKKLATIDMMMAMLEGRKIETERTLAELCGEEGRHWASSGNMDEWQERVAELQSQVAHITNHIAAGFILRDGIDPNVEITRARLGDLAAEVAGRKKGLEVAGAEDPEIVAEANSV